ncbi:transcriptional regulator [Streptomyces himastatinicus ATCC 53653]|uniref:Transcriptional regulator n=1 Tax=Streptomyces himastatinicus ATCC 53653 TaxID=457427 RepID=D9WQ27_9ACTN|nr:LCP family protein [Streptomyces himastatinicus]EFL25987.1 transcriptional regulator [Streptomyces himastatinicus ATCC 53653]
MNEWADGRTDRNQYSGGNGAYDGYGSYGVYGGYGGYGRGTDTPHVLTGEAWGYGEYAQQAPPPPAATVISLSAPATVGRPGIPSQRGGGAAGSGGAGSGGGPTLRRRPPKQPASRRRRITRAVALLVSVPLLVSAGTYVWADSTLDRKVDLGKAAADRPPLGKGTNYLIVGSDSRNGLSGAAKKQLHTGSADGGRTDSMMVLHTGAHGSTLMSLPRDSWVTIPSFIRPETGKHYRADRNKLNAAYSLGGPDLLIRTIEHNTGLRINHYAEIGFAGFVGLVNAVGGVNMCVNKNVRDEKSGLNLTKGCHNLDGSKALAFVRQRHQEAEGDLGRSKNQQKFLAALAHKAATPGVALDPFTMYPTMRAGLDTLIVDKGMEMPDLLSLFRAMKGVTAGDGQRVNVPVSSTDFRTSKGDAVRWNTARAKKLFGELRHDRPVSRELR